MCIRDSILASYVVLANWNLARFADGTPPIRLDIWLDHHVPFVPEAFWICLLYTSDAADERSSVDLGGRRIIKKKKKMSRDSSMNIKIKDSYTKIHNT